MSRKQQQHHWVVIGAQGYVGRQIALHLKNNDTQVICTSRSSQSGSKMMRYNFFHSDSRQRPLAKSGDTIVFAAMVEDGEKRSVEKAMEFFVRNNAQARLIYISSDAVFSGRKGFYGEDDPVNPKSNYGENLARCEVIIQDSCPDYCILRPSYLYGFSDSILDNRLSNTRGSLRDRNKVYLFSDMYKSPLGIKTFAEAVISIAQTSYTGTLHVAGQRMSVYNFHRTGMELLGVSTENLIPTKMPLAGNYLRDTSLDTSRWKQIARPGRLQMTDNFFELDSSAVQQTNR
ncbi:MAG: sugar nucleotide-binding protein [Desulfobacterales bacterium]|nr:sugar nucleotide-binding protein [Deltaproteobacteria bacterium]NNK92756.1 sugar nucleotide-binding protein [Desulfobacterales bacterium]